MVVPLSREHEACEELGDKADHNILSFSFDTLPSKRAAACVLSLTYLALEDI